MILNYHNRLKFVWNPFTKAAKGEQGIPASAEEGTMQTADLRIAGTVKVSFDAAIDKKTAILSAMLVDLGDAKRSPKSRSSTKTELIPLASNHSHHRIK